VSISTEDSRRAAAIGSRSLWYRRDMSKYVGRLPPRLSMIQAWIFVAVMCRGRGRDVRRSNSVMDEQVADQSRDKAASTQ
jgi:hypothetical protein